MRFENKCLLLAAIGVSFLFTGCENKNSTESSKSDTPVVAKVNGDEISIQQVNFQLSRLGQLNEEQGKVAAKQVLARLVDQQLLKQKAIDTKLDRDPRVLQALDASKNEILAQSYLEQLMSKATKPSTAEVDTFYKENPELFENRRIFRLQELAVDVKKDKVDELVSNLKTMKSFNEIAIWLKSKNYSVNVNSNVRAAEQLPLELLKKIQPLKDGEFILLPTEQSLNILNISASQSVPISRDKADPIIEQYFISKNKTSLAKKELEALKDKSKIEYVGAFADMKNAQPTSLVKTSAESSKQLVPTKAPSQDKAATEQSNQTLDKPKAEQANMDKGLSGL